MIGSLGSFWKIQNSKIHILDHEPPSNSDLLIPPSTSKKSSTQFSGIDENMTRMKKCPHFLHGVKKCTWYSQEEHTYKFLRPGQDDKQHMYFPVVSTRMHEKTS